MKVLADRIQRISESQTLEMAQKSRALKEKGIDVIDLSVGVPDFATPEHIKKAAKEAIDNNFTFYTPVQGIKELIEAIQNKFKTENNIEFSKNQIVVSNGAKQALANVILTLIDEKNEILIPAPYWVTYKELDNLANGKNIFIKSTFENEYKVTAQQVKDAITPNTRAFLFCSPSNPSGSVYTKNELKEIAEVIAEHPDIYIISDEIYEHMNFNGKHESISQFDFIKDQLIIINGVSKAYAMTGWRIGYLAAPEWIAKSCKKLQGQYTSGACSVSQKAAYAALTGGNECIRKMLSILEERKNITTTALSSIEGVKFVPPKATFYVFPDFSYYFGKKYQGKTIKGSLDLSMFLLEHANVAVVGGTAFGIDECIRISFVVSKERIVEAFDRITNALKKLK